jgi:tetratricopeptide (TPR) repeat protein
MDTPVIETWPLAAVTALTVAVFGALWLFRHAALRETGRDPERVARAIASARRAAAGKAPERRPLAWARAQMQLVMLLAESGGRSHDRAQLAEALAIVADVVPILRDRRLTPELATALYYRARAEWGIGMLEAGTGRLEAAVAALRELLAFEPWPRHLLRAVVVSLPAVILLDIGERRDDPSAMAEGVALAREAAGLARRRIAVECCIAWRNLCHCLAMLGRRTGDEALLEEAVAFGRKACDAIRQRQYPGQWAASHASLGHALGALGELRGDAVMLAEALVPLQAAQQNAGTGLPRAGGMMLLQNIGGVRLSLGRLTGDPAVLDAAVADLRAALAAFRKAGLPFARAETARMLGDALAGCGARDEAAAHYRKAMAIFAEAEAHRHMRDAESALARLNDDAAGTAAATHTPVYQVR